MPLPAGTRLGSYEILAPIGAGGMGEVYRARDTRLDRSVAIKVLPAALAQDRDRLARFEREAKVLAALNHPNIAQIYGLEESNDTHALVMELVPGAILKTPQPIETVRSYAGQIAEALEAAHEKGITHRDLKPANIMVTPEGVVKVLDFGLAAIPAREAAGDSQNSPTLTMAATQAGMIMGTAAYMSPEQAAGKVVDKRSDIWSFGVVLYEMLSGNQLFHGETISHTLADVLRAPINLDALPPETPLDVRRLLARCLQRDPKNRLRDIGEARIALTDPEVLAPIQPAAGARTPRRPLAWAALVLAAASAGAGGVWLATRSQRSLAQPVTRLTIALPAGEVLTGGAPAVSRDGRFVAYPARGTDGTSRLFVRALDRFESSVISGSEGAQLPFFSPDGTRVGFFAGAKLQIASREGGAPRTIADASYLALGATWGEDDTIFFVPSLNSGILRVPASGGKPEKLTEPDEGANGYAHAWPQYLFDTHSILYSLWGGQNGAGYAKVLLSLRDGKSVRMTNPRGWSVRYAQSGHLLTSGSREVIAAPFDPRQPGESRAQASVVDNVFSSPNTNTSWFAVSDTGTLVYAAGDPSLSTLTWVERAGTSTPVFGKSQSMDELALSPDGTRLAVESAAGLWIQDLRRGTRIRLVGEESNSLHPNWNRDGSRVLFASNRGGDWDIYSVSANGGPTTRLLARPGTQFPLSVAPDGTLLFSERTKGTASDLWTLSTSGTAAPFAVSAAAKVAGQYSPDGRMVAYVSDESGRDEVYVCLVAKPGEAVPVSAEGGDEPLWAPSGKELFYRRADAFLAVSINPGTLAVGETRKLFEMQAARGYSTNSTGYAVSPDGRFLVRRPDPRAIPTQIDVVLNWFQELTAKVPVR